MRLTEIAKTVMAKRYLRLKPDGTRETPDEMIRRVARVIAAVDAQYGASPEQVKATEEAFYRLMDDQDFMPNSPTFTGAGTQLGQLSACFVLPIGDSLAEIYETMKHAALIHQTGGGTGFAFSRLRPAGDVVRSSQGVASGPVSFLKVYNASTEAIKQGGTRRGANMGILRVDHPDILEFIHCKDDITQVTNFNISVAITDRFMEALKKDEEYELINPRNGEVVRKLRARDVWEQLIRSAWATGEPGIIFIDRINRRNPNKHAEVIEATNPCGEQPLPPYGSCNLGSINLANFVRNPYTDRAEVDWDRLATVVHTAVHFLDNVIDANKHPLPQIAEKSKRDRRIGLGVMGWAEMLVQLGLPYDSEAACAMGRKVMSFIKQEAVRASSRLAEERGVYPEWEGSEWQKAGIKVRNATLTTVAPTGTISLFAARPDMPCSGGIEPKFALVFTRNQAGARMLDVDGQFATIARREGWYSDELMEKVAERGSVRGLKGVPEHWQEIFATAHDITPYWHVRMQAAFQGEDHLGVLEQPIDAAVSKTINFPHDATVDDVREAYELAWELGLKGITVYRDGSRMGQVLTVGKKEDKPGAEPGGAQAPAAGAGQGAAQGAAAAQGTAAAQGAPQPREATQARGAAKLPALSPRPSEAMGKMFKIPTHFGNMTLDVHINEAGEPFEVIVSVGAAGSDLMADAVAMGMLISTLLRLRSDVPWRERVEIVIDKLKNIGGSGSYGFGPNRVTSLASAIAKGLQRFLAWYDSQAANGGLKAVHELAAGSSAPGAGHPALAEAAAAAQVPGAVAPGGAGAAGVAPVPDPDRPVDPCPECGSFSLVMAEGCSTCYNCGYSKC
ncbi:MAG: vitamin B12-dependent ribonucleotide reductase [Firmicutes bacterium]|nr:vitamin B12-dependent ribonucleotide reductase [Bacillota bacterium]